MENTNINDMEVKTYLDALLRLDEDIFSKEIIVPLFKSMGYSRVDFHGGVYERGKDIIALMEIPPLTIPHVTVIQSKKIGGSQKTKDAAVIRSLIDQLQQCYVNKFPIVTGDEVRADNVMICCPEQMTSRLIEDIHGQLTLYGKETVVFDGPRIIDQISKYNPSLFEKLLSLKDKLLLKDESELCNIELFSALNQKQNFDLVNCYSDLSFFVGHIKSSIFLSSNLIVKDLGITLNNTEWKNLKNTIKILNKDQDIDLVTTQPQEIDSAYSSQLKKHTSDENREILKHKNIALKEKDQKIESLNRSLDSLRGTINSLTNYDSQRKKQGISKEQIETVKKHAFELITNCKNLTTNSDHTDILKSLKSLNHTTIRYKKLNKDIEFISQTITNIINCEKLILDKDRQYIQPPSIIVKPNKPSIEKWWYKTIHNYKSELIKINNENNSSSSIKSFLSETEKKLFAINKIFSIDNPLRESIELDITDDVYTDRAEITAYQVFDSGHDIAVYGEAGVGKTTTLQMYAQRTMSNDGLTIYLPLNRVLSSIDDTKSLAVIKKEDNEVFYKYNYTSIIKLILIGQKIELNNENTISIKRLLLNENSFQLILDGLDEAYDTIPEILESINDFKKNFPNVQIIISSRDCVSYLDKINFLGITLLPFTENQLSKFIKGWFNDNDKAESLMEVIKTKDMFDVVKTPLIATILCSLVEKGINAPSSENAIYSKRLSLLCGEYDTFKNIERQELTKEILEEASQKLAFSLHSNNKRSARQEELEKYLYENPSFSFDKNACRKAVSELTEKCNVLIKDNITGHLSFGHFRFQEHLVSLEIKENRGINLPALLKTDWWRGAFSLYAQTNDIEYLFQELYDKHNTMEPFEKTLREMIKQQPKSKIKGLNDLLKGYLSADQLDNAIGLDLEDDYSFNIYNSSSLYY